MDGLASLWQVVLRGGEHVAIEYSAAANCVAVIEC